MAKTNSDKLCSHVDLAHSASLDDKLGDVLDIPKWTVAKIEKNEEHPNIDHEPSRMNTAFKYAMCQPDRKLKPQYNQCGTKTDLNESIAVPKYDVRLITRTSNYNPSRCNTQRNNITGNRNVSFHENAEAAADGKFT